MTDPELHSVLFTGILALSFLWIVTTPRRVIDWYRNIFTLENSPVILFQLIPLVQILGLADMGWKPGQYDQLLIWAGLLISAIGAIVASLAKFTMQENWGPPGTHDITKQKKLVTSGLFSYTRNPTYLGLLLVFIGIEISLRSWGIILAFPLYWYMLLIIDREEHFLTRFFGKRYRSYLLDTPRFFPNFF